MTKYQKYIERQKLRYDGKDGRREFSDGCLNQSFVHAFNNGARITVSFRDGKRKEWARKRGTVGVTTGWTPCFLLMLTKRSRGSSLTIGQNDVIVTDTENGTDKRTRGQRDGVTEVRPVC